MNFRQILTKNITIITLLLALLTVDTLFAQQATGIIKGKVKTSDNNPAETINVLLANSKKGAVTKADGSFEITIVPVGDHSLIISRVGLETKKVNVSVSAGEIVTVSDIVLNVTEQQLEEVTITDGRINKFADNKTDFVSRLPLDNMENPQVYSIIGSDLMQEQQVTSIQDAIQNAPGINSVVEGVGSGGVGLTVNLRGFSTGTAMRNGMATNYVTMSDPINLERIEVIKGPSATLFGSTLISYGGLINRVTKKPTDTFKGEVGYSTGSFALSRLTLDLNTPLNDAKTVLFRVNAAKHNEKSFQDYGRTRSWSVSPNLLYKVNDRLTLNVEAELFHTNRPSNYFGISSGVAADNFDDLEYDFDHSYGSNELQSQADVFNVFARASYKISDNWVSQTNFSSGYTDNHANYLFLTFLDNSQVRRMPMNIKSNFNSSQIQQNFIGTFNLGSMENKLLVGVDYYFLNTQDRRTRFVYDVVSNEDPDVDFNYDKYLATLAETDPYVRYERETQTYSAYISDVLSITDQLTVMASLRLDHFSNEEESFDQTALSPKLGIVYQAVEDKVSLFANYMDGFQNVAPDNTDPENIINFEPEHATQIEGGIKTSFFNGKVNTTISYYDITVKNIVRSVPDNDNIGGFNSVQDGTQSSKGFEVELIANPVKGWNIVAGYGYNDSKYTKASDDVEGNRPYSTPENTFNLWTSYKFSEGGLKGFGLGFGGNYVDECFLNDANTFTIPSYTLLNASVFYDKPAYRIGLKLNNLLDEEYWTSSYWAMPQKTRNFVASFVYRF
ncbi:MAG: TonB-dependent siderophore receptor [Thalassobius sp.]|nr:TonB-dependent siderophore receptor [Thalassovita sp.]